MHLLKKIPWECRTPLLTLDQGTGFKYHQQDTPYWVKPNHNTSTLSTSHFWGSLKSFYAWNCYEELTYMPGTTFCPFFHAGHEFWSTCPIPIPFLKVTRGITRGSFRLSLPGMTPFFHAIGVLSLTYKFLRVFSCPLNIQRTTWKVVDTLPFDFHRAWRNKLEIEHFFSFRNWLCQSNSIGNKKCARRLQAR